MKLFIVDGLINLSLRLKLYPVAYWLAAKYMPPIHPLNFRDEPDDF